MNANFITIHGIDGVGKSSVALELARLLNEQNYPAIYYDNLTNEIGYAPNKTGGGYLMENYNKVRLFVRH